VTKRTHPSLCHTRVLRSAAAAALFVLAAAGVAGAAQTPAATPTFVAAPTLPSFVSAANGLVAWSSASGSGNRYEVVIRRNGRNRPLTATSATGWIDAVKLGTDTSGQEIVVYSRCPHQPFANATAGNAGTDGCRLWWAPISGGGQAQEISAAPPDTNIGVAVDGTVVFAVAPNTGHPNQPVRLESAQLTGGTAQALTVPTPDGATINDLSANGSEVAFSELPSPDGTKAVSEIWLESNGATPQLVAKQAFQMITDAASAHYFDGLTLTADAIYAFLVAQPDVYPPVPSQVEEISLPSLTTTAVLWIPGSSLKNYGIQVTAFDASDDHLVLSLYSVQDDLSHTSSTCATAIGSPRACPVALDGTVTFG